MPKSSEMNIAGGQKKRIYSASAQNGFPKPKKTKCFQCRKEFLVKFVISKQNFSKKNNWGF